MVSTRGDNFRRHEEFARVAILRYGVIALRAIHQEYDRLEHYAQLAEARSVDSSGRLRDNVASQERLKRAPRMKLT